MTSATPSILSFVKGHGTENDFVLVADPDDLLDLGPGQIAAICDRRAGVGGDGFLRAVRTVWMGRWADQSAAAEWFMDYWNADGSTAEMCGNGIRVFVAFLLRAKLIALGEGEQVSIGTRAGVKTVRREGDNFAVAMGPWRIEQGWAAVEADGSVSVMAAGATAEGPGMEVNVGNPHAVVELADVQALAAVDLSSVPALEPAPPGGVNVEFVVSVPDQAHLAMRVCERGSGETRSCGTGAVAAVLAARARAVQRAGGADMAASVPGIWTVDVPGGRLRITVPDPALVIAGPDVELAGPAVLVAEGEMDLTALLPLPHHR
jgi:diaminopimelate epimerase